MNPTTDIRRVFVGEFLCGGGMMDTPLTAIPASLLREGTTMWRCLIEDLAQWTAVRTPVDPRLNLDCESSLDNVEFVRASGETPLWRQWIEMCQGCDVAIVIAPETDDLLTKGVAMLRSAGIEVLAPAATTLGMASDKWTTAKWLHRNGLPHPQTVMMDPNHTHCVTSPARPNGAAKSSLEASHHGGYVVKPRDGCGGTDIRFYQEYDKALADLQAHEILQPRWVGRAASTLVIADRLTGRCSILPAVWQNLSHPFESVDATAVEENKHADSLAGSNHDDASVVNDGFDPGGFCNLGGCGPAPPEVQFRARSLVDRLLGTLPGKVCGFLGVDLLIGENANHDAIIEINPRLTTSYMGLRRMTEENLSRRLFEPQPDHPVIHVSVESEVWRTS